MSKKCYRFFGGLLTAQEHWLNKMSEKGYRLIRAEKMLYEFEACKPDQVKYCVEFIGQKSKANASDYHEFLEGMGYKVFYKNINLNYSVGKVRLRPWAEKGGRIATNATTFNRELLIVEKDNDGKPFELHHIGQRNNGSLAILTSTEHDAAALHGYVQQSEIDRGTFNTVRKPEFWKTMGKMLSGGN